MPHNYGRVKYSILNNDETRIIEEIEMESATSEPTPLKRKLQDPPIELTDLSGSNANNNVVANNSSDGSITSKPKFKVYKRRWYILGMFSLCGVWQNLVYGTFGPISKSAEEALKLTQTDFALIPNWYNVAFILSVFPFVYLVETKGLRLPMMATMAFCAIGASIRCLHTGDRDFDKVFLHLGQLINGFGAAVPWFACTKISAVWFPPKERNLATSIGLFSSGLGVSFGFLVGPQFVGSYSGDGTPQELYNAIYKLLYLEAVICNALLFVTIFYFPSKPPTPPSFTAATKRFSYWHGFRQFAKNRNAWLMFIIYGLNTLSSTWDQFLALIVKGVMEETEVGWLGFTMTAVSIAAGPIFASFIAIPRFAAKSREISIGLLVIAVGLIALFAIAACVESQRYLLTRGLIWGTLVPMLTLATVAQPVWWEMTCDCVFPVPETIVSGIFTIGACALSVIFFVILMFETLGFMWINWVLLVSQFLMIPLLLIYRHDARRTTADIQQKVDFAVDDSRLGDSSTVNE